MKKFLRPVALAAGTMVFAALGTTGVAFAASPAPTAGHDTGHVQKAESATADGDGAAQDAACTAAGVDPAASNIQYDDATGVCSLDGGGQDEGEN